MEEISVKGVYGSSLTLDADAVTIRATGRLARGALGASERRIAYVDITDRAFRPANFATNGHIEIVTEHGKSIFHFMAGKAARAASEAYARLSESTPLAGSETKGRGLTTKSGTEGITSAELKESWTELRDSLKDLRSSILDARVAALFPGLQLDGDTVTFRGVSQPVAGARAIVESTGDLRRRTTLTRVAIGDLLAGPAGAIAGGLLMKKQDSRQIFILIDGVKAAWAVPVKPDQYADATRFAALFNTAAKQGGEGETSTSADLPVGLAEQLGRLAQLHRQGSLTDDEFAQAKQALLDM